MCNITWNSPETSNPFSLWKKRSKFNNKTSPLILKSQVGHVIFSKLVPHIHIRWSKIASDFHQLSLSLVEIYETCSSKAHTYTRIPTIWTTCSLSFPLYCSHERVWCWEIGKQRWEERKWLISLASFYKQIWRRAGKGCDCVKKSILWGDAWLDKRQIFLLVLAETSIVLSRWWLAKVVRGVNETLLSFLNRIWMVDVVVVPIMV